jgi:hypothetical protein
VSITAESKYLNIGATEQEEYRSRKAAAYQEEARDDRDDDEDPLTEEELAEVKIAKYCQKLLKAGVAARGDYETFDLAWELYIGDMWPRGLARWKAKITINKIRALIHFMQAVMTDNKPRYTVNPRVPGTDETAALLQKLVDRDWDENEMQDKLSLTVLYGLIWGTGIMKVWFNPRGDGGRGKHEAASIVPYRIFTDRLAQCVEDARFLIHIEPRSLGWIYENFPNKAKAVKRVKGSRVRTDGDDDRDYIREGQKKYNRNGGVNNPEVITGPGIVTPIQTTNSREAGYGEGSSDSDLDEIEVAEFWFRDETTEPYKRMKRENGEVVFEDVIDEDTGLPELIIDKQIQIPNPIDGTLMPYNIYKAKQTAVWEEAYRPKYPNGRLCIMAGPVVLADIPNPYETSGFPFATWKNQDVGAFFGQGEPLALKDLNIGINRIVGQIYDNLNLTGNPSFLVDKNAGIEMKTLRSRPGLVIPTDNVVSGMKALDVRQMPPQFFELAKFLSESFNEVSGIADSLRAGNMPANTSFATVDTLQESSSATLRQKVRNLERMIKRIGKLRIELIQQFDDGERPIRNFETQDDGSPWVPVYEEGDPDGRVIGVIPPASSTRVRFQNYVNADLKGQVEFEVVPDSSLSTSPSGMWNRYMSLWDKKLIDLQSFHEKFELDNWRLIVQRLQAMQAASGGGPKKKPGPAPSGGSRRAARPAAPSSQMPSRLDLNASRAVIFAIISACAAAAAHVGGVT